jgi:hypothetical protein
MEQAMDKGGAAVARYRAMAGLLKKLPPKAARLAKADAKHVAVYVTKRRGRAVCDPLKMVRFVVDICGLNLKEASCAVRAAIRAGGCGAMPGMRSAEGVAITLYKQARDMPDAVALARFFGWALDKPEVWDVVRVTLNAMSVSPEATGIENWQEQAR